MEPGEIVERLHSLLMAALDAKSPVLSGNMKAHITASMPSPDERMATIDAPFYDIRKWEASGVVVHTGATIAGRTAYAEWVNRLGGFATGNASKGWVDRTVREVVQAIANEIGAEVVYDV